MTERSSLSGWTPEQIAQGRQWVETWRRAGKELDRIRREEIRLVDHRAVVGTFDDAFAYALRQFGAPPASGLVEQQRIFARAWRMR